MALPVYTVRTRNLDGSSAFDCNHNNLEIAFALNGPGSATWTMPIRDPGVTMANFAPWKRECVILRDGVGIWGGYVTAVNAGSTAPSQVRVHAQGWLIKLFKRVISDDKIYDAEEQFDLVWNLINYTQAKTNGDMGFTRWGGETPSGIDRTARFRYWERRVIGDVIQTIADHANGFDYEITWDKIWKVYHPRKTGASGQTFQFLEGDETNNVYNMSIEIDGADTATEVHGIGGGDKDRTCLVVVTDSAQQLAYKRLEEVIDFPDIKHFDSLMARATKYLNLHKGARFQPQLSITTDAPVWGTYEIGETATIDSDFGFLNFNGTYRIIAIVIHATQAGNEVNTVHFDEVLTP